MDQKKCSTEDCTNAARGAVRTTRPTRPNLKTLVWWDEREAPATAQVYCKKCMIRLLGSLADTLLDLDEEHVDD